MKLKEVVLDHFHLIPKTLIILGSGLNELTEQLTDCTKISYEEIFFFESDATIGHNGYLHLGYLNDKAVLVMEGRRHYYEEVKDEDMRFIIQSFARIGVKNMVVTNACGGMNESFAPGDLMVIEDHINMMGRNPLVGPNEYDLGPRFVDMSEPYDLEYRRVIDSIAKEHHISLQHGIYVAYLGPSYETKAEIRAFRMLGGDAVGMSTVPEVIIARHAGMRVLGISVITNMATGISKTKLNHEEVLETSKQASSRLMTLLSCFITKY